MFSRFFNRKNDTPSPEEEPIPSAAPAASLNTDGDFEHIGNETVPALPYPSHGGLYPQFGRLGIQTQQSIDKGPQQCLMGVPFKLSDIVMSKNNASVEAQMFQIREIHARMRSNLDRPAQLSYEFNAERNVLQSI